MHKLAGTGTLRAVSSRPYAPTPGGTADAAIVMPGGTVDARIVMPGGSGDCGGVVADRSVVERVAVGTGCYGLLPAVVPVPTPEAGVAAAPAPVWDCIVMVGTVVGGTGTVVGGIGTAVGGRVTAVGG